MKKAKGKPVPEKPRPMSVDELKAVAGGPKIRNG